MGENFLSLAKDTNLQVQGEQPSNRINPKKSMQKNIIIKLLKIKTKFESHREKCCIHYLKGSTNQNDSRLLVWSHESQNQVVQQSLSTERKELSSVSSVFSENILQEGRRKERHFWMKENREFVARKPLFEEWLKGVL